MSMCGNCPYPYEAMLEDPELTEEDVCGMGCMHEDAVYRAQWAYDKLQERYKELEEKYEDITNLTKNEYQNQEKEKEMTLRKFLLHHTNIGDLVWITNEGWYTGFTMIDHEDVFINSLNPKILDRIVTSHKYIKCDWTNKPVILCDTKEKGVENDY